MFNVIDIFSFISVSVCVGIGHSTVLFPRVYNADKTGLPALDICLETTRLEVNNGARAQVRGHRP